MRIKERSLLLLLLLFVVVPLLPSYSRLAVVIPSCPVHPARNALQDLLQSAL